MAGSPQDDKLSSIMSRLMEVFDEEKVTPEEALAIGSEIASLSLEKILKERGKGNFLLSKERKRSPHELPIRRGWIGLDRKLLDNN